MSLTRFTQGVLICSLMFCCILLSARAASGQRQGQASTTSNAVAEDVDLDVHLHLIVASNGAGEGAKLPAQFDATIRQLRSSLPYNNYRWAATFINRVNNGADSSVKGLAGPLLGTTTPSSGTPSFYDLQLTDVSMGAGGPGQAPVRLRLHFGARLPIQVGGGGGGGNTAPVVNYETTGISTALNIRESEPVVVGTMSLGPSNEMLVLVISVKRVP
ncbi:MAG TPA: hypothetical protein VF553_04505 [Pyrinomonadaceae bacterium]|jgi:hypothetical protein